MTNSSKVHLGSVTSAITARAIKQLSKFAACLIGTIAICLGAYTLTVDSLIQDTKIPASYKWFLLKDVPGPRIIIESGSNSHHAIDTDALGAALGMTAINIADNGGYALEDKITRLETYARPGDVVVLPLEWTFYHREKLTDNYVDTLFTSNRDYYRAMPALKRVKRALSLPPEKIIEQISGKKDRAALETESPAQALFISALTQSTGHQSRRDSTGPGLGVAEQSCDDYILGKATQRRNLTLGANIKPALKRLKALKARGVDIHFAWPVLAGDGCMSDQAYVTGFRAQIEADLRQHVDFTAGWWAFEPYGRWMRDNRAMFRVTLPEDIPENTVLKIQGLTKSGQQERVNVSVNGQLIGSEMFGESAPLLLPVAKLPRGTALSIFINLPEAGTPRSPYELGENEDTRSMTLHLQTIELATPDSIAPVLVPPVKQELSHIFSTRPQPIMTPESTAFKQPLSINAGCAVTPDFALPESSSVAFDKGWWDQEALGRWMKGREANFDIALPEAQTNPKASKYRLTLQGDFFMGRSQPMSFMIDGQEMGEFKTAEDGMLSATFIPAANAGTVNVTLQLSNQRVQSPKMLGLSDDNRTLTFFLKSVGVSST